MKEARPGDRGGLPCVLWLHRGQIIQRKGDSTAAQVEGDASALKPGGVGDLGQAEHKQGFLPDAPAAQMGRGQGDKVPILVLEGDIVLAESQQVPPARFHIADQLDRKSVG